MTGLIEIKTKVSINIILLQIQIQIQIDNYINSEEFQTITKFDVSIN